MKTCTGKSGWRYCTRSKWENEAMGRMLRRLLPLLSVGVLAAILYDASISTPAGIAPGRARKRSRPKRLAGIASRSTFSAERIFASSISTPIRSRSTAASTLACASESTGPNKEAIEPGIGDLHPAVTDCLSVTPPKDTEYKLTADDGAGHTTTASLTVKVR